MVFLFFMAFCAVEPFATWSENQKVIFIYGSKGSKRVLTAWGPYGDLSVEDMLAADRLHPGT